MSYDPVCIAAALGMGMTPADHGCVIIAASPPPPPAASCTNSALNVAGTLVCLPWGSGPAEYAVPTLPNAQYRCV